MNDPLKKYRRRFRLWNNQRKLLKEQQVYSAKFQKMGLSIPSENDLDRKSVV